MLTIGRCRPSRLRFRDCSDFPTRTHVFGPRRGFGVASIGTGNRPQRVSDRRLTTGGSSGGRAVAQPSQAKRPEEDDVISDTHQLLGRRSLLTAALGAVTGAVAATLTGVQRVLGASDDGRTIHVGDSFQNVTTTTELLIPENNGYTVLDLVTKGGGYALMASATTHSAILATSDSEHGVEGRSQTSDGVRGLSGAADASGVLGISNVGGSGIKGLSPDGTGVFGSSASGSGVQGISSSGRGVYGQSDSDLAVYGYNTSSGTAILGYGQDGSGVRGHTTGASTPAIVGHAYSAAAGVTGISGPGADPSLPADTGVVGIANADPDSVGVRGISTSGRGGVFQGNLAQLRLKPSSAASHPARGQAGDLFLDHANRLWFCKAGTNWRQLA
jgi:hypothetical protein